MGAVNNDGIDFLSDLGRRVTQSTLQEHFLFQWLVLIQRYSAGAVFDTLTRTTLRIKCSRSSISSSF